MPIEALCELMLSELTCCETCPIYSDACDAPNPWNSVYKLMGQNVFNLGKSKPVCLVLFWYDSEVKTSIFIVENESVTLGKKNGIVTPRYGYLCVTS